MKRTLSIILALVLCVCTFSSCGKKDTSGKNFAVACESMPETFDPQIASSQIEKTIALNCFDTLMRPDENGVLQCLSAESYSVSADGLVYTFKIRDGLKFFVSKRAEAFIEEKGGELPKSVTAYDFAFGITRAILPETEAEDYTLLSHIKNAEKVHNGETDSTDLGVKALDEKTLVITLSQADGNFLFALSQAVSAPCNEKFFNLTAGRYGLEQKYTISNGAFYVSNTASETSVSISKNAEYKGVNEAVPNAVTFYLNSSMSSVASKLKKGNYDCGFVDANSLNGLGSKNSKQALTNITYSFIFNFTKDELASAKLREGLISAIDLSSFQNRADGIASPDYLLAGAKINNSGVSSIPYDVEKARNDLKDALKEIEKSTVNINILCTEETEKIAKTAVSSWQTNIGVELNGSITVAEQKDFDTAISKKEFDIAIYPISSTSSDATSLLSKFTSENKGNIGGYSSEEYDRIFADLNEYPTAEKFIYAQSFLIKNAVAVPIYFDSRYFVLGEDVSGIYFTFDTANIYFYKGRK